MNLEIPPLAVRASLELFVCEFDSRSADAADVLDDSHSPEHTLIGLLTDCSTLCYIVVRMKTADLHLRIPADLKEALRILAELESNRLQLKVTVSEYVQRVLFQHVNQAGNSQPVHKAGAR